MPNYWLETTGRYYFSGMYTAVLPMIPGIWAIVRTFRRVPKSVEARAGAHEVSSAPSPRAARALVIG
jgi:hypothetical protein